MESGVSLSGRIARSKQANGAYPGSGGVAKKHNDFTAHQGRTLLELACLVRRLACTELRLLTFSLREQTSLKVAVPASSEPRTTARSRT
jgi:hypothetical protein